MFPASSTAGNQQGGAFKARSLAESLCSRSFASRDTACRPGRRWCGHIWGSMAKNAACFGVVYEEGCEPDRTDPEGWKLSWDYRTR